MFIAIESGTEIRGELSNYTIPRELIFFDDHDDVKLFQELNTVFTKNVVVEGRSFDMFSMRTQWVVGKNAFSRLMTPILAGLQESGTYTRWEYFNKVLSTNKYLKTSIKRTAQSYIQTY